MMAFDLAKANCLESIADIGPRWNIEVEAKPSFGNFWGAQKYDILPHGDDTGLLHTHNEAPEFHLAQANSIPIQLGNLRACDLRYSFSQDSS